MFSPKNSLYVPDQFPKKNTGILTQIRCFLYSARRAAAYTSPFFVGT